MSLSHSTFRDLGAQTLIGLLVEPPRPAADGQAAARRFGAGCHRRCAPPRTCRPRWSAPSPTARSWWSSSSSTGSRSAITVLEEGDRTVGPAGRRDRTGQRDFRLRVALHRRTDDVLHAGPAGRRRGRGRGGAGGRRAPDSRPAGRVPHRRHRHRGRRRALPRGQCVARADRDLDAADVGDGGRPRPRRACTRAWWSGRSPAAPDAPAQPVSPTPRCESRQRFSTPRRRPTPVDDVTPVTVRLASTRGAEESVPGRHPVARWEPAASMADGAITAISRRRSSWVANSTTMRPLVRPSSSRTRVSKASESVTGEVLQPGDDPLGWSGPPTGGGAAQRGG